MICLLSHRTLFIVRQGLRGDLLPSYVRWHCNMNACICQSCPFPHSAVRFYGNCDLLPMVGIDEHFLSIFQYILPSEPRLLTKIAVNTPAPPIDEARFYGVNPSAEVGCERSGAVFRTVREFNAVRGIDHHKCH